MLSPDSEDVLLAEIRQSYDGAVVTARDLDVFSSSRLTSRHARLTAPQRTGPYGTLWATSLGQRKRTATTVWVRVSLSHPYVRGKIGHPRVVPRHPPRGPKWRNAAATTSSISRGARRIPTSRAKAFMTHTVRSEIVAS